MHHLFPVYSEVPGSYLIPLSTHLSLNSLKSPSNSYLSWLSGEAKSHTHLPGYSGNNKVRIFPAYSFIILCILIILLISQNIIHVHQLILLYIALCFLLSQPLPFFFFFFSKLVMIFSLTFHNQNSLWSKSSVSKAGMLTRVFYSLPPQLPPRLGGTYLVSLPPLLLAMDWVFVSSKIHVLNLIPNGIVLEVGLWGSD